VEGSAHGKRCEGGASGGKRTREVLRRKRQEAHTGSVAKAAQAAGSAHGKCCGASGGKRTREALRSRRKQRQSRAGSV